MATLDQAVLLELLAGAGIDTSTLDQEKLGGIADRVEEVVGKTYENELERARRESQENLERYKGQVRANSEQAERLKALEAARGQKQSDSPDLEGLRETVTQLMSAMTQTREEMQAERLKAEALQHKVDKREKLDALAKEFPALGDYPGLVALAPDENLREWAETIQNTLGAATERAYTRYREGYMPPSSPPRVSPDKPRDFQREIDALMGQIERGAVPFVEGRQKLDELAKLMKP